MAEHGAAEIGTATGTDYADHLRTYEGFVPLSKWGSIFVVIVLILFVNIICVDTIHFVFTHKIKCKR